MVRVELGRALCLVAIPAAAPAIGPLLQRSHAGAPLYEAVAGLKHRGPASATARRDHGDFGRGPNFVAASLLLGFGHLGARECHPW
jgi:hypothetical protein